MSTSDSAAPIANARAELRRLGGDAFVRQMVELFLELGPRSLNALRTAVDAGDLAGVEAAAHALRSSASHVGAKRVEHAAEPMEDRAEARDPAALSMLAAVENAFADDVRELEEVRASLPAVRRVAVVDDSPDIRLLVRTLLRGHYDVAEYSTAVEALAGFARERPDVVLLDVSLPGLSGDQLLRRMRAIPALRGIPIAALTAHASPGDRQRLLELGFDEYLAKPIFDETLLIETLERLLRSTALPRD